MGKVITFIRRFILTVTCLACICLTIINYDKVRFEMYGTAYIVSKYADTYYEMLSDNVGITTINGISNVYSNMKKDGYSIYKEDIKDNHIDVSFVKNEYPSYRFYFTYPEGRITFFCSEYEDSYTGLAYINEERVEE